jgi:predicted carbohydrate-binding protein with CBM5 and CBM33 domain
VKRLLAAAFLVGAVLLIGTPASAHGALSTPASRAVMCGNGTAAQKSSAACKAAVAAGADVAEWDNIRVPNVNGRDREMIPDGKLCGGGLVKFDGLNLPRTDWPTTKVTGGASLTFAYQERIPHEGTFRIYVTKAGFDPAQPLKWTDLDSTPFLTAKDPKLTGGAYRMTGKLPQRTGRQIIFTIWQTSSTPDTYYSCSDVVFSTPSASPSVKPSPSKPSPSVSSVAPPAQVALDQVHQPSLQPAAYSDAADQSRVGMIIAGAGAGLAVIVGMTSLVLWRRRH